MQESEERYRTILKEGPLGIVLASLDLEVQYVNQRFCEMLGYSEMERFALGIAGISHPNDRDTDYHLAYASVAANCPISQSTNGISAKTGPHSGDSSPFR